MLETEDPKKLAEFAYLWSDLMRLTITPVLEDSELAASLEVAAKSAGQHCGCSRCRGTGTRAQ